MHVVLAVAVLWCAQSAFAHPLDQVEVRTDSRFSILKDSVRFEIKFPAHAFHDARGGAPAEAKPAVESYLRDRLLVFDGRSPLALELSSVEERRDALSAAAAPRFYVASGTYRGKAPLKDVYIFNEFFREGPVPHLGEAVIEWRDKKYDFQFKPKTYFRLEVGK
jgi:hypothetical protein